MFFKIAILISIFTVNTSFASGDHSGGEKAEIKEGGAVTAFNEADGFKLSKKATQNLGIKFEKLSGSGPWIVPKSSLIYIKHSVGVYRKWDGWVTMVLVKELAKTDKTVTIQSIDLQADDQIAISGVNFLRMTDADLNSDTVDACAH